MEIFYSNSVEGGFLTLGPEESAHCVRVLRHRSGDEIAVIDGLGTLYRCVLEDADPAGASARITGTEPGFGSHPYKLTMAVCPTKNADRYEWFAEKATEIGVDNIVPVIGDRSERKVLKTERLERLVLSAAKQSLKGAVPQVLQPVSVRDFILGAPEDAVKMICYCFEGDKSSIPELLGGIPAGSMPEIYILIGPEGDFSPEEAALAASRGWHGISLGNSRLRTETAAVVAATLVYAKF